MPLLGYVETYSSSWFMAVAVASVSFAQWVPILLSVTKFLLSTAPS